MQKKTFYEKVFVNGVDGRLPKEDGCYDTNIGKYQFKFGSFDNDDTTCWYEEVEIIEPSKSASAERLEKFTLAAMQGLCAYSGFDTEAQSGVDAITNLSVGIAKATIAELDKELKNKYYGR